ALNGTINIGDTGGTIIIGKAGSNFQVDSNGVVTLAGGQTRDITTAQASAATAIILQPGTSTANNATGAGLSLKAGDTSTGSCGTACTGGTLTLQGGSVTNGSGTRNGGGVSIDAGTGATANGAVNIGTANAASLTLGNTGAAFTLQGNASSTLTA